MGKAPPGAEVGFYFSKGSPDQPDVEPGDAMMSMTGRTYLVIAVRRQTRGKHVGRFHVRTIVSDLPPPAGVKVHRMRWDRRRRR